MIASGKLQSYLTSTKVIGSACLATAGLVCALIFAEGKVHEGTAQAILWSAVSAGAIVGWYIIPRFMRPGSIGLKSILLSMLGGILATLAAMPIGSVVLLIIASFVKMEPWYPFFFISIPLSFLFAPVAVPCGLVGGLVSQLICSRLSGGATSKLPAVTE